MYLEFYRLQREPFHITPDPDFLFPSPSHNEALASIVYGVEKRKGFVALTGEVGTGKTTILRAYLRREEGTNIKPIYLFHPDLSFRDLVIKISRELGLESRDDSTSAMLERLQEQLIEEYREDRTPVLIIDEAQNMPKQTLEQLRMLTNLETSKDKLLQVVLVGQPELDEILNDHSLRQLKQRISVRATILPLTHTESSAYVRSRIERAGGNAKHVFTDGAIREVVAVSGGIPRTINTICDNALIAGYGAQQRPVPAKTVREAAGDLSGGRRVRRSKAPIWAAAAAVGVVGLAAAGYWILTQSPLGTNESPSYALQSAQAATDQPANTAPQVGAPQDNQKEIQSGNGEDSSARTGDATEQSNPSASPESAGAEVAPSNVLSPNSAPMQSQLDSLTVSQSTEPMTIELPTEAKPVEATPETASAISATDASPMAPGTTTRQPMVVDPGTESVVNANPAPSRTLPPGLDRVTAAVPIEAAVPNPAPQQTLPRTRLSQSEHAPMQVAESRIVKQGDCLSRMISDVYDTENYQLLMGLVLQQNPQIVDPDALLVGMTIKFPVLNSAETALPPR